jgi:hypothetical protein
MSKMFLGIFGFLLWTCNVFAESPQVFRNEFVVYFDEPECPWGAPCSRPLSPGLYWFTGEYLDEGNTRRLEAYDAAKEKRECGRFKFKNGVCSANHFFRADSTRNDLYYKKQWALQSVRAEEAWKRVSKPVHDTIAVFDTGVNCSHPDLQSQCVRGYDAISNKMEWEGTDLNGHGTHAASIACATSNNSIGISGISDCKVYPVRVLGNSGGGSLFYLARGLEHVRKRRPDIRVYNLSLGTGANSPVLSRVIEKLRRDGIHIIAAAGNEGKNNDLHPHYPANYMGVVSVGASDVRGNRARFSNFGNSVDVFAPGDNIVAAWRGGYRYWSGTSFAAPHVAGAVALTGKIPSGDLDLLRLVGNSCNEKELRQCKKRCERKKRGYRRKLCKRRCTKRLCPEG